MKKQVVFDCDGTVVSTMGSVIWGLAQVLSEALSREISVEEMTRHYDADVEKIFSHYKIDAQDKQKELMRQWASLMVTRKHRFDLFPGVKEMLTGLKEHNIQLALWTGRDRKSLDTILEALELTPYFTHVISRDEASPKPSSEGLKKIIDLSPGYRTVMVGDSYVDMDCARELNIPGIAVTWCPHVQLDHLERSSYSFITQSVSECYQYLMEV